MAQQVVAAEKATSKAMQIAGGRSQICVASTSGVPPGLARVWQSRAQPSISKKRGKPVCAQASCWSTQRHRGILSAVFERGCHKSDQRGVFTLANPQLMAAWACLRVGAVLPGDVGAQRGPAWFGIPTRAVQPLGGEKALLNTKSMPRVSRSKTGAIRSLSRSSSCAAGAAEQATALMEAADAAILVQCQGDLANWTRRLE